MNSPDKRVLVGMSGGIDSTATCLMLKEQGYEIVGLTMWVWGDEPVEARQLAGSMGIEHHVADEREAFRKVIVQNFIDEYCQGRTPNPCVMCNPTFKFRILTEWADKLGCAFISTGHYSRLEEKNGKIYIVAGDDDKKDQSYFLWRLGQDVLRRCIFPLGTYTKLQVREYLRVDQGQELYPALAKCDVAIDFSHHAFTSTLLAEAVANNKPLVIGTTGHTELERQEIVDAAASIPIVFASNYSVGVNALFWLTRKAAQILGGSCDIEVMEMHHRHKIDAPSGTARTLAEILSSAIDRNYEDSVVFGREGLVGPRPAKEIGMHSLRGGDVVGDHTVIFASDGERLELTHKASSRMTFASGAVRAALWLQGREPGLYTMEDVLGLSQL